MRDTPDLPERFYEIYAVDGAKHWQGAVALDVLLRSRRPVQLAELIDEDRRRVSVLDDQEEVARLFGKYNLVAAPVVDTEKRLVGVITIDDVVDMIEEEADEDLKALGGVTSDEELSDSFWTIAKGRFNWLLSISRPRFWRRRCSGCSKASSKRWSRSRCWRRSWPARAATPRPPDHDRGGCGRWQPANWDRATPIAWSCARRWSASSMGWPSRSSPALPRWPGFGFRGSAW